MNVEDAYHTLKNYIELDEDTVDAYETVTANPQEYKIVIERICDETKSSIENGQSIVSLGELIRQFYNATHRQIDDKIIELPGSEFCKDVGIVANESIQQTIQINEMTEAWAVTQASCNSTCDISYM